MQRAGKPAQKISACYLLLDLIRTDYSVLFMLFVKVYALGGEQQGQWMTHAHALWQGIGHIFKISNARSSTVLFIK